MAAFDFDGTLTNGDSVVPFLRRFVGRPIVVGRATLQLPNVIRAGLHRDRDRLRIAANPGCACRRRTRPCQPGGAGVCSGGAVVTVRTDTSERLAWHRSQGHRVVIVSASYDVYLHDVAEALGVEAVLATRLESTVDGRCTGRLQGANCRGPEKVRRLERWFESVALDRSQLRLWAYGDSPGDIELLAYADHPVWVNEPLASVAAIP